MSMISKNARSVRTRRFGEGIIDSAPTPAPWIYPVRETLTALNYTALAAMTAIEWLTKHQSIVGCSSIEPEDFAVIDRVRIENDPDLPCPAPTEAVRTYEPSPDDVRWWASHAPSNVHGYRRVFLRPRPARPRQVSWGDGRWSDRDQAKHSGV